MMMSALAVLVWQRSGFSRHKFGEFETHYLKKGQGPPVVLVHGFGASWYHWRYNADELSKTNTVYCPDLLGFGLSEKPNYPYSTSLWSEQLASLIEDVVGEPAVVVGNSLGGGVALQLAATRPDLVKGVGLLNAAIASSGGKADLNPFEEFLQKALFFLSFKFISRTSRVTQVLKSVYTVDPSKVDDDLVDSIMYPATLADSEVYRMVVTRPGRPLGLNLDDLMRKCRAPVLLLWGLKDPWITPATADLICETHKAVESKSVLTRVDIESGHCPQDETPELVNSELSKWLSQL